MNKTNFIYVLLIFLLSGCAHIYTAGEPKWRPQDLPNAQTKNNITVAIHVLTLEEIRKHYKESIEKHNIKPVYIAINNNTNNECWADVMDLARISEEVVDVLLNETSEDTASGKETGIAQALLIPAFPLHLAVAGFETLDKKSRLVGYFSFEPTAMHPKESIGGTLLLRERDIDNPIVVTVKNFDKDKRLEFIFKIKE